MTTECTNLQREILRVKVTLDSGIYTYATNGVELWSMLNAALLNYGCESFTVTAEDFKARRATIEEADLR